MTLYIIQPLQRKHVKSEFVNNKFGRRFKSLKYNKNIPVAGPLLDLVKHANNGDYEVNHSENYG